MAEINSNALAFGGFLTSAVGGFVIGLVAWYYQAKPCTYVAGGISVHGQCVGSNHDAKSYILHVGGICTVVGWAIVLIAWIVSLRSQNSDKNPAE
jgi:uncharacterized membrane protein